MQDAILREKANALAEFATQARHALHRTPELTMDLPRTLAFVKQTLGEIGVPYRAEKSWVIADIEGGKPGKTVGLRADMDALPIQEATGVSYASEIPGQMHACGHDAHTAILLGTAKLLWDLRAKIPGRVRLFFQPAEEAVGGAEPMIAAGAMEGVHAVYALHMAAQTPVGRVATKAGPMYANQDNLYIDVLGKSGHGAHPSSGVDAIVISAQVVTALQTLVTRELEATEAAIITIANIHGGAANNILCDEVRLRGTMRTLTPQVREQLRARIPALVEGIAKAMGGDARVTVERGYSAVVNDAKESGRVLRLSRRLFGEERTGTLAVSSMGAEDFAYFLMEAPGAMYHLGCGSEAPLHNDHFLVDDACLPEGMLMHAALVFDYLSE